MMGQRAATRKPSKVTRCHPKCKLLLFMDTTIFKLNTNRSDLLNYLEHNGDELNLTDVRLRLALLALLARSTCLTSNKTLSSLLIALIFGIKLECTMKWNVKFSLFHSTVTLCILTICWRCVVPSTREH